MTASNPCCECKKPLQYQESKPRWCERCERPIKETPAAKFCECKGERLVLYATDGKNRTGICKKCGLPIIETPAAVEKDDYDKDMDKILDSGLLGHMPQPEKEWWEVIDDILLDFCDKDDCKELDHHADLKYVVRKRLRLLADRIAAQSEKKGREDERGAVDAIFKKYEEAYHFDRDFLRETRKVKDAILAARSSEEGKTV